MRLSISSRRGQNGQALVVVALLIVAMVGMVGLAIDGGRIYIERRVQQTGTDAAVLAAADKFWADVQPGGSPGVGVKDGFVAGLNEYSYQTGLSGWSPDPSTLAPPDSACAQISKGGTTFGPITFTQGSGTGQHKVTLTATPSSQNELAKGLCIFTADVIQDSIPSAFIQVVNGITQIPVSAEASAVSAHALSTPTLLVLNTDCKSDWKADGNSLTTIVGTAWSDGNITDTNSGNNVTSTGEVLDHCDAAVPSQITATGGTVGHAPIFPDPFKSWPSTTFDTQCKAAGGSIGPSPATRCNLPAATTDSGNIGAKGQDLVELQPGQYTSANSLTGSGCWFLVPGMYEWNSSAASGSFVMGTHSQVLSNELVPPGAQDTTTNLYPSVGGQPAGESPLFDWSDSAQTCRGGLQLFGSSCGAACKTGVAPGTYYLRVTSARKEASGNWRESYMSNRTPIVPNPLTFSTSLPQNEFGCIGPVIVPNNTGTGGSPASNVDLQVGISNVPGMGNVADTSRYNIYASKTGCGITPLVTPDTNDSTFGFVTKADFSGGTKINQVEDTLNPAVKTLGCPDIPTPASAPTANKELQDTPNCTLNYLWSTVLNSSDLGSSWKVQTGANEYCDILTSSPWTDGSGCVPDYLNPASSGDTANEDYCVASSGTVLCAINPFTAPTGSPVTPGGAIFYFPSSSNCISQTNGAPYVFGSLALRSVVLYAEAPGICAVGGGGASINGGDKAGATALDDAQFIGVVYFPTALLAVAGGGTPIDGSIVIWMLHTLGDATTKLTGRFPQVQVTIEGHLITCTTTKPSSDFCPSP